MPKEFVESEAKRLMLDKCLRGEFALVEAAGKAQPQPEFNCRSKAPEPESAQQPEAGSSTNESAKPQPVMTAKSKRKSVARHAFNRFLHLLCRFGPGGATLRPLLHRM